MQFLPGARVDPVAQWTERTATDREAHRVYAGSTPAGIASARVHVGSSCWCPTTFTMTGARGPSVLGSARWSRHGLQSRRGRVRFPSFLLTWSSQRPVDLDDGFISRAGCGSSPPAATKISGCSEVVSRCVRDAETAGSIPVTPTMFMPRARESAVRSWTAHMWSTPGGAPLYSTGSVV